MLFFTRTARARPGVIGKAMTFVTEVTGLARSVTGLPYTCHLAVAGRPAGTLVWSTMLDSVEQASDAGLALMGDHRYLALLDRSRDLLEPSAEDRLYDVVHTTADGNPTMPMMAASWATAAPGRLREVADWGVEINERVAQLTGRRSTFLSGAYGPYGDVAWIMEAPDAKAVDVARAKLGSDDTYLAMIDEAGEDGLFVPASGFRALYREIG